MNQIVFADAQLLAALENYLIQVLHLPSELLQLSLHLTYILSHRSIRKLLLLQLLHPLINGFLLTNHSLLDLIFNLLLPAIFPTSIIHFKLLFYQITTMFTNKKKADRSSILFQSVLRGHNNQFRKTESFRQSLRKPIFGMSKGFTEKKPAKLFVGYNESALTHIKPIIHDDFCGCQHNLQTCPRIKELLENVSMNDMRRQYEQNESASDKRPKLGIRRKYLQHLPSYYPEIFHAHLTNILCNLQGQIPLNEFFIIAWIEYHSKLQYVTFFLYLDLKKAQISKKNFFDQLDLEIIKYQITLYQLELEANTKNILLKDFITNCYETMGANLIPLSQYGLFLKTLLNKGYKWLIKLLGFLLGKKRSVMLQVLKKGTSGPNLRQIARELPWESFFQQLKSIK